VDLRKVAQLVLLPTRSHHQPQSHVRQNHLRHFLRQLVNFSKPLQINQVNPQLIKILRQAAQLSQGPTVKSVEQKAQTQKTERLRTDVKDFHVRR
jgi:hypothetical protein